MWNMCGVRCPNAASDKIAQSCGYKSWITSSNVDDNAKRLNKKVMVVDCQPINKNNVSRVVSADSKSRDRKKIIPDSDLIKSIDISDFELNYSHSEERHSEQTQTQTDIRMNPLDFNGAPDTEYRQSFTWNKPMVEALPPTKDKISESEYSSSFSWPNQTKTPIFHKSSGNATQVDGNITAKKSATISNFAEVIGKPDVLFSKETPTPVSIPIEKNKPKKSEYNSKFKPFSTYVYIQGDGFKKSKDVESGGTTSQWYNEVEERARQANQYKTRSQLGHPVSSEGLELIYSQGALWNTYHKDRDLQALALATTQKIIEEKREERNWRALVVTPHKSAHSRQLNSAPPSLRSEAPLTSTKAAVSMKSPNVPPRPKSADRHTPRAKMDANSEKSTPKPEGKVWLKSKKLAQETTGARKEAKKEVNSKPNGDEVKSHTNNEHNEPKSPRPTSLTASFNNNNNNNNSSKPIPVLPPGPVKTTQIRSPEEITGIKSPSPESWTVPIEGGLNWMNGETPNNFDSKFDSIKQTPITTVSTQPSSQSSNFKVIKPETNKNKSRKSVTTTSSPPLPSLSSHLKPTAKVMPSSSSSISSSPSVDEEVKIIKPISARQKASNVLDKARHRLDHFWSRNK